MKTFHIISMSTYGKGLSGGDKIFIELTKRIGNIFPVYVYLWEEGLSICKREGLNSTNLILWSSKNWSKLGFLVNYIARIFIGIFKAFSLKIDNTSQTILYSASEFWQDSLPAVILKLRYPKIIWIAAWYQTAPNPFQGFRENGVFKMFPNIRALLYWFVQKPIKPIIKKHADLIFVTSDPDRANFPKQDSLDKVLVIKGGVDLVKVKEFQKNNKDTEKKYDAVFQGRFHPQKGLLELIDIWKKVVNQKNDAKLVLIGDGPLKRSIEQKIKNANLEKNIILAGYLFDGSEKYKIFSQSKIVLHPAVYDSGGMAAAEAMAFGLPGISFNLKALKTYYPKGMIKIPIGNINKFSQAILELLSDKKLYKKNKHEALKLIRNYWSWDILVSRILANI